MVGISDHLSVETARLSSAALAASPTETTVDADAEVKWAIEIRRRVFVLDAGHPPRRGRRHANASWRDSVVPPRLVLGQGDRKCSRYVLVDADCGISWF